VEDLGPGDPGQATERRAVLAGARAAFLALLLPLSASCALVGGSGEELRHPQDPPRLLTVEDLALRDISASEIDRHMDFLRSVHSRGRAASAAGAGRVGAWLGSRFQLAGLEPAGEHGGYVQYWPDGLPEDTARSPNVVALLPGGDPARATEYVILLVRLGPVGAPVEDPAGDAGEATGAIAATALLAEVARALVALPAPLPRPVLFLAAGGGGGWEAESWFAAHPTVDLSAAAALLAVGPVVGSADGRGGGRRPGTLMVAGPGYPMLGPFLENVVADHPALGLQVGGSGEQERRAPWEGELSAFARLGIPAVVVWARSDEAAAEMGVADHEGDAELAARLARVVFVATHRIAAPDARPGRTEASLRPVRDR
jgi:hypothetical protein